MRLPTSMPSRRAAMLPLLAAAMQPLVREHALAATPRPIQRPEKGFMTPSGLRYFDFREGSGPQPKYGQLVRFHYVAYVANENVDSLRQFDSTYAIGSPYLTKHGNGFTAQGIEEALHTMRPGGLRRVILPRSLSFKTDKGPVPQNRGARETLYSAYDRGEPLIYDLQLVSVIDDLVDRGDYEDGDISELAQLADTATDEGRSPGEAEPNPFAAGNAK